MCTSKGEMIEPQTASGLQCMDDRFSESSEEPIVIADSTGTHSVLT